MINDGNCKSKIAASFLENGKPCAKTSAFFGTTLGELYSLGQSKLEKSREGGFETIKAKTDDAGRVELGLSLPDAIGVAYVVAGRKKNEVSSLLANPQAWRPGPKGSVEVGRVQIVLESGKPSKMTLEADATELTADGVSTAIVSALITDELGNPVRGETVSFESDLGTIDPDTVNAITDEHGIASARISSQTVGKATVRAANQYRSWIQDVLSSPPKEEKGFLGLFRPKETKPAPSAKPGQILSGKIEISFLPSAVANLILGVDAPATAADGTSRAAVWAQLKDEFGNPIEGAEVVFETDMGEVEPSGKVTTGPDGKAVVHLASTRVGVASVRARTLGSESLLAAIQVTFEPASPASIEFVADSEAAFADGKSEHEVRAEVRDKMGNPVPDKPVTFETDIGSLVPGATVTTDGEGCARVGLVSRTAGRAKVKATCGEVIATTEVEFSAGTPTSFAVSLNPTLEAGWKDRIPPDHLLRLQQSLGHMRERRFDKAMRVLEAERDRIKQMSDYPALCNLAYAYQQAGRKPEAERIYRSVIQHNGTRREIRVKVDEAEEVFGIVLPSANAEETQNSGDFIELAPRDYLVNVVVTDGVGNHIPDVSVEFTTNFGWIPEENRRAKTNSAGAATSIVTTFASPSVSETEFAWVNLGAMKENALDYSGAEECYRSAISLVKDSTRGLEHLASLLVKTGDTDGAKKCFYNVARAFSRKGQLQKALEYYSKTIELDPKYAKALAGYGAAYLQLGDMKRARMYLEESVKIDKSLKSALANLGLLYHLTGKFEKAVQTSKRALKIDPSYKPALVTLHQIHTARGERDRAKEYAAKIRQLG